ERRTQRRLVPDRQEHVNLARRELTIVFFVPFDIRCLDVIEGKVPTLLIAEFGHPLEEIRIKWRLSRLHTDKADAQHLRMQLRVHGARPSKRRGRRRAANEHNELAPSHVVTPALAVISARRPGRPVTAPAILGRRMPPLCEYRLPQKCPAALWADLNSSDSR